MDFSNGGERRLITFPVIYIYIHRYIYSGRLIKKIVYMYVCMYALLGPLRHATHIISSARLKVYNNNNNNNNTLRVENYINYINFTKVACP